MFVLEGVHRNTKKTLSTGKLKSCQVSSCKVIKCISNIVWNFMPFFYFFISLFYQRDCTQYKLFSLLCTDGTLFPVPINLSARVFTKGALKVRNPCKYYLRESSRGTFIVLSPGQIEIFANTHTINAHWKEKMSVTRQQKY